MTIIYILKSAMTLALLYGMFFVSLERETFYRFNRRVILAITIFSLAAPGLHAALDHVPALAPMLRSGSGNELFAAYLPVFSLTGTAEVGSYADLQILGWLQTAYFAGVAVMGLRLAFQALLLTRNLSNGTQRSDGHGNTIILKSGSGRVSPFSIFSYIVMSEDDYEQNRQYILTHEQEHIRLRHSYDKLFMEFVKIVQWFNPAVWLLCRDLDAIHEYEADEAVLNKGIDAKTYQTLLVVKAVGNRLQPFANNLNRGSLKNRIIMMNKKKSNRWMMLKALFIVPVAAVAMGSFAMDGNAVKSVAAAGTTVQTDRKTADKTKATSTPDVMPEFKGGLPALMRYLEESMKYPVQAQEAKKEGMAAVSFVIDKDGNVKDVEIQESAGDTALDTEAIRVVKSMPQWTPGTVGGKAVDVKYTIPLQFKLDKK